MFKMMKKNIIIALLTIMMAMSLISCGAKEDGVAEATTEAATEAATEAVDETNTEAATEAVTENNKAEVTEEATTESKEEKTESTTEATTEKSAEKKNEKKTKNKSKKEVYAKKKDKKPGKKETKKEMQVSCMIECKTVLKNKDSLESNYKVPSNGIIKGKKNYTIKDGDTVLDVLKRTGVSIDVEGGDYVAGIDGLYEFDCGKNSGWMYSVNGSFPNVSARDYKLKNGDRIRWSYTCNYGDL